jgi:hypothetical protein
MIVKWPQDSGLKVNESKAKLSLFHYNDNQVISISIQNQVILSEKSINFLGVTFDFKVTWSRQAANAICKANSAQLIKRYMAPLK